VVIGGDAARARHHQRLHRHPVAVAVGALIGLLNGLLVNYGRYQAVVATLCMNFILSGFALGYAPAPVSGTTGWLTSLGATVGGCPAGSSCSRSRCSPGGG